MTSPFPGMDPYLEQTWRDFHTRLLTHISEALNPALPPDLSARIESRVYVESSARPGREFDPDLHVYRTPPAPGGTAVAEPRSGGIALAVRPALAYRLQPVTDRFINIYDRRSDGRVVTTLEILSPTNKRRGDGRDLYLRKQDECRAAEVNLVEIDLVRAGRPTTVFATSGRVGRESRAAYHVSTLDFAGVGRALYFPMPLRDPLPTLPIPLRHRDGPAALDLQAVVSSAYERGYCWRDVDYDDPPTPPLDPPDAAWAAERVVAWRAANRP